MTSLPGSPRLQKGVIVGLDLFDPVSNVAVFESNPGTVTRSLQVKRFGDGGDRSEAMSLQEASIETMKLEVETNTTDFLEHREQNANAVQFGIAPQRRSQAQRSIAPQRNSNTPSHSLQVQEVNG